MKTSLIIVLVLLGFFLLTSTPVSEARPGGGGRWRRRGWWGGRGRWGRGRWGWGGGWGRPWGGWGWGGGWWRPWGGWGWGWWSAYDLSADMWKYYWRYVKTVYVSELIVCWSFRDFCAFNYHVTLKLKLQPQMITQRERTQNTIS